MFSFDSLSPTESFPYDAGLPVILEIYNSYVQRVSFLLSWNDDIYNFFSRPSPKAGRELQTELDRIMEGGMRAVSLHRDCVLVYSCSHFKLGDEVNQPSSHFELASKATQTAIQPAK